MPQGGSYKPLGGVFSNFSTIVGSWLPMVDLCGVYINIEHWDNCLHISIDDLLIATV